ncbi:ribosomal protein L7/L12 [Chloropicon roscoffensis]|uniref:Ribosomal protein L7/L12 n=1 Tax=Chloropicon roscoffensis TaxID=1461544 RepID=A0A7S3FRH6_9CHLO
MNVQKNLRLKSVRTAQVAAVRAPRAAVSRRHVSVRSAATDEIVEKLKGITLLEAADLVKQIEETFGVDASASAGVMVAAPGAGGDAGAGGAAAEEKTEFDLVITEADAAKKIACIKVVRALTSLGLKEAKDAVTNLPHTLFEGRSKDDCEDAMKQLAEAGAKAEMK